MKQLFLLKKSLFKNNWLEISKACIMQLQYPPRHYFKHYNTSDLPYCMWRNIEQQSSILHKMSSSKIRITWPYILSYKYCKITHQSKYIYNYNKHVTFLQPVLNSTLLTKIVLWYLFNNQNFVYQQCVWTRRYDWM